MDTTDVLATLRSLENSFLIDSENIPVTTIDQVKKLLIERIVQLLSENPEKLMNMMYRFDVSEKKIHEIFTNSFPFDIPEKIADLILERQQQKLYTRKLYAEHKDSFESPEY